MKKVFNFKESPIIIEIFNCRGAEEERIIIKQNMIAWNHVVSIKINIQKSNIYILFFIFVHLLASCTEPPDVSYYILEIF